jgi:hypothetical protein
MYPPFFVSLIANSKILYSGFKFFKKLQGILGEIMHYRAQGGCDESTGDA